MLGSALCHVMTLAHRWQERLRVQVIVQCTRQRKPVDIG